jgi:serine-type D-Ala-D-Ala endopeptidase (penicillin-binding protein 7)
MIKRLIIALVCCLSTSCFAITAQSFIVTDMEGNSLLEKNPDERRSIASITKLFVAEQAIKLDPDEQIQITRADVLQGQMRSSPLRASKSYTRKQLTELALVSSDNIAAIALGRSAPPVTSHATLFESSGLNPENQSTAREIAAAARELYNTEVGAVSTREKTEVGNRNSTNPFLSKEGWTFWLSKTGFINQSGGCLVVVTEIQSKLVTVVILGASNTRERWQDLIKIRKLMGDSDFYVPIKVTKISKQKPKRKR